MTDAAKPHTPLHTRILVGMAVGVLLGLAVRFVAANNPTVAEYANFAAQRIARPVGQVFIRMVSMVVMPLVFSALVLGVVEIGDPRRLGRIGLRSLAITGVFSLMAVLIGVGMTNLVRPGVGLTEEKQKQLLEQHRSQAQSAVKAAESASEKSIETRLLDMLPANLMLEVVGAADSSSPGNGMLAVMTFALIFGVATASIGERGAALCKVLEGVFAATMAIIGYAMALAPYAVACLMFSVTVQLGAEFLAMLAWFMATVIVALAFHAIVVYSLAVWLIAKRSPVRFFKDCEEAILVAFATSSSNATLPATLRVAKEKLKVPPKIAQFVLTVGATGNQNGTALFEGVVVLFLAQVFGKDLTLAEQFTVVLMAVMAGIGTAGVPGGSMPLIVGILRSIKLDGMAIGLVIGVDRILDMSRTVVNVVGDLAVAVCVSGMEKGEEPGA
jgi:DAACS family dicarboxylate/amino acid:cation (Na+ or H+) symporter